METGWIKIYTSTDFYKTEMVRQVLVDQNIEAIILNKQDSQYKFGEVEVHIPASCFQQALEIIIQNEL